jgi:hypothetical protein
MRHQGSMGRGGGAKGDPRPTESTSSPWGIRTILRQGISIGKACRLFHCNTKHLAMHEVFQKTKEYPAQALGITTHY